MQGTLRFVLASLLAPAVVLLGETALLAQFQVATANHPGLGKLTSVGFAVLVTITYD